MTTTELGVLALALGVITLCLSRHLGVSQVAFMNDYWGTALTDRAARLIVWSYCIVAAALMMAGIALLVVV